MTCRRRVSARLWTGLIGLSVVAGAAVGPNASPGTAAAAPPGDTQVVAYIARGVGNGHGRGLSQWGAYGRAVNGGQSWTTILDSYYGGTSNGSAGNAGFRVRLTDWDGTTELSVMSEEAKARWNGSAPYKALVAR